MGTPANQMSFPPPGVDPQQYYAAMRQQMLAQYLTQYSLTPPQEATPVGGGATPIIRSRLSPIQPISNLVAALMARKAMDKSAQMNSAVYGQALQPFGGPSSPDVGAPTPSASGSPTAAPAPAGPPANGGGAAPSQPVSPDPTAVTAPLAQSGPPPLNPLNLPPALAFQMWMKDPSKYGELIAGTPEWRSALAASNGNVPQAQRLLYSKLQKEGVIELRTGGEALIPQPGAGFTRLRNPNLPQGAEPTYGPNGEIAGAHMISGVPEIEETIAGAGSRGKALNSLNTVPTGVAGQTREQFGLTGIPGAPGAAGGVAGAASAPGASGRAPPQYFPAQPSAVGAGGSSGLPQGPTGGAQGPDWWPNMPRVPNETHIGYTAGDYQEKLADLRAKKAGDYIGQFGLEADTGDQKLEYSTELLRNLPNAFTGPNAQSAATFWNTVNQIPGIRSLLPQGIKQDSAGTLVAVKNLVNQAIQGARAIYGPRMANQEVQLQKNEASPSIGMGLQAILLLQRQEDAKSAYFVKRKEDFDQFMAQGGDPLRFEGAYQHRFPLAKFASDYAERNAPIYAIPKEIAPPAMVKDVIQQDAAGHPTARNDFVARYGYLPPDFRR